MPDDAPEPSHVPRKPAWLDDATLRAMEQTALRAQAFGRDAARVQAAARDVALAHMPSAPMGMIDEAVQAATPDPQGLPAYGPEWRGEALRRATDEEVTGAIS